MKKTYTKPDIFFESFELSTNIAGDCERKTNTPSSGQCGIEWGDEMIFLTNVNGCSTKIVDGSSAYNGLCYHNPSADKNMFNS